MGRTAALLAGLAGILAAPVLATPVLAGSALAAQPGATGVTVLRPASRTPFVSDCSCGLGRSLAPFEPSGLVWDGAKKLYAVSDSGQIVQRGVDEEGGKWSCLYVWCGDGKADPKAKAEHDFESLAFVPGAAFAKYLWIGVEGGEYADPGVGEAQGKKKRTLLPRIRKFDIEQKKFVDAYWSLGGAGGTGGGVAVGKGSGVESMTFVPDAARKPKPGGQNLGGIFLVSSQHGDGGEGAGRVYAYDLDGPSRGDAESGESFLLPAGEPFFLPGADGAARKQVSADFYYAPAGCALYVAYDDESDAITLDRGGRATLAEGRQSVAVYGTAGAGKFVLKHEYPLPAGRGLEAATAVARPNGKIELFTAVDMSGGQNPGELTAASSQGRIFAKKKDLKAAKGQLLPNTLDRYAPLAAPVACSPSRP